MGTNLAARVKTLPHVKTMEATEPKYLPDRKNLRSSVIVLDTVGLSPLMRETTSACNVSL